MLGLIRLRTFLLTLIVLAPFASTRTCHGAKALTPTRQERSRKHSVAFSCSMSKPARSAALTRYEQSTLFLEISTLATDTNSAIVPSSYSQQLTQQLLAIV